MKILVWMSALLWLSWAGCSGAQKSAPEAYATGADYDDYGYAEEESVGRAAGYGGGAAPASAPSLDYAREKRADRPAKKAERGEPPPPPPAQPVGGEPAPDAPA